MNPTVFTLIGSLIALLTVTILILRMLKADTGTEEMLRIATAIESAAKAYLKKQYSVVTLFYGVFFVILCVLAYTGYVNMFVPFAFLTGGFFSGLAGYIGMRVATKANVRTTQACKNSINSGLRIAFMSGTVMGLVVVGLGLLDLSAWYYLLDHYYSGLAQMERIQIITSTILTFGVGASFMALFARVGGGIFTKAADVGADLVGKVEAGIPEDDLRNPAVIADNVGDNVGDVAGMGADLYESYVGSIIATMALGVSAGLGVDGVTVPMVMASVGILASILGTFLVKTNEMSQRSLLWAIRRGIYTTSLIVIVAAYFVVKYSLGLEHIGVFYAVVVGLLSGIVIGLSTEYYTSSNYRPTRSISMTAERGTGVTVITGLSVGMQSTVVPVITVGIAVLLAYYLAGGAENPRMGIYGVGISAVGMLSTLGITLSTDAYGPIADNAGGIAEMSKQDPIVRDRAAALDQLGNTTAATGKGFAIGSAALTALALIAAYHDRVLLFGYTPNLSLLNPRVIFGLFIGGMLPLLFSSLAINAVGSAAGKIVAEVRRQFNEIEGILSGNTQPDYETCIKISVSAAQRGMILPALIAILSPIVVGLLVGVDAVVGLLVGATVVGFITAVKMANTGGAFDNAKKYIEEGRYGGKGSEPHKVAVLCDTIGDPLKDTAGPSLNILIKLMSMVAIVSAQIVITFSLG